MRITPIDIETRRFTMKFRGFHPEEVASFLEQIREELEDLLRENAALKEAIYKADNEIKRFWETQDLLSVTLQEAHQKAEDYKIHARKEADSLLEKSEEKVLDMIGEARDRALQISEEIEEIKMRRKEFDRGIRDVLCRFEAAMAEGAAFQEESLHAEPVAAEDVCDETKDSETEDPLLAEDQISVIEGHKGEESGGQAKEY